MIIVETTRQDLKKFRDWESRFKFLKDSPRKNPKSAVFEARLNNADELRQMVKDIDGKFEGRNIRAGGYRVAEYRET